MKTLEYIGVALTVIAYTLIVMQFAAPGFLLGMVAQSLLCVYFYHIKSFATMWLQFYFVAANMYGLIQLGV